MYSELVAISWIIFIVAWVAGGRSSGGQNRGRSSIKSILFRFIVITFVLVLFLIPPVFSPARAVSALNAIGVAFAFFGVTLAVVSRWYLGKNWGAPQFIGEAHGFVGSGPYRHIRHPIYAGALLALLAACLVHSIIWFIPLILFYGYFARSIQTEEKLLTERFPCQYARYQARTKKLIPLIF